MRMQNGRLITLLLERKPEETFEKDRDKMNRKTCDIIKHYLK